MLPRYYKNCYSKALEVTGISSLYVTELRISSRRDSQRNEVRLKGLVPRCFPEPASYELLSGKGLAVLPSARVKKSVANLARGSLP